LHYTKNAGLLLFFFFLDGTLLQQIRDYKASQAIGKYRLIEDIIDGKLYKERFRKDGYFQGSTDKDLGSFQINTDGVSLFHSSSFSI
jgi:hypothetical protein